MISGVFFFLFAFILLLSAIGTLCARQPVHSVLMLIVAFFNAAGLFLTMGAEFLAFILLIVYVGAVAVLFLFVVMMLDVRSAPPVPALKRFGKWGLAACGLLVGQVVALARYWPQVKAETIAPVAKAVHNTEALGRVLYTDYFLPFQLSGLVLLVAIVGAIVLTYAPRRPIKRQSVCQQLGTQRQDVVSLHKVGIGEGIE